MTVSDTARKALREAMERLKAGRPLRTDGAFTKQNLYKEAGVSRATMNRATEITAEWDRYVDEHGRRTQGEARRDADLDDLRRKLRKKTEECTALRSRLDAAATVIAALHHDNQALREHLASRTGRVADLDSRRMAGRAPATTIGPC
jgi:chromosome segregation ATPase